MGMAIKPQTILELASKSISDEEERTLDELEQKIDVRLQDNFYDGAFISYPLEQQVSFTLLHELAKRYREAGWKVLILHDPTVNLKCLYFTQGDGPGTGSPLRIGGVQ
jgi:hypothetical protein